MEEPNTTDSLVLAATNYVKILDEALARPFDVVIEYGLPNLSAARAILERRLGKFEFDDRSWKSIEPALKGCPCWKRHLRHVLASYQKYYNEVRTHLSLQKDAPVRRDMCRTGRVRSSPILGGLHHQYVRV
jgi:SpoVK/Ycf46/Vps4 family AAA+-type ATPase